MKKTEFVREKENKFRFLLKKPCLQAAFVVE